MEFKISITSGDQDFSVQQSQNLRKWIEDDEELELISIKQNRKELEEDEAGGDLLSTIQVIISATIEPVAKTIQVWMKEKTKRSTAEFKLELEDSTGKKYSINSRNIKDDDTALITEIVKQFEGNQI